MLGLLWQIIRVSLEQCPGLANLLEGGEQLESLMKMSPEAILLRWVNYQLERAGVPNRINNFTSDIKNSEAYTHLLHHIASPDSGVNKEALMESDLTSRAELMLQLQIIPVLDMAVNKLYFTKFPDSELTPPDPGQAV